MAIISAHKKVLTTACVVWTIAAWLSGAAFGSESPPVDDSSTTALRARELFSLLIGIDSTHAHGSTGAAQAIEDALLRAGLDSRDVELLVPQPDKGNLLIRLRGHGTRKPILFIGHLDVVEARPEDWSVPPFALTERDGYFYGRGTQDMKNDIAAAVANLIRLHEEHYRPDRDLYFAFTSDEEAGGTLNGVKWLLDNRPELRQVDYVVNFDAGGGDSEHGVPELMRLQTSEKESVTYELEVTDAGGHSSLPTPDNAIFRLAAGLVRLAALEFPMHLTATSRGYLEGISATQAPTTRADMLAVAQNGDAAAAARLSRSTAMYNATLRTTCTATQLAAGHAQNALPQRAAATIQCRLIPGESAAAVYDTLVGTLADPKITVRPKNEPIPSPETAVNRQLLATLKAVTAQLWPAVPVVPAMDAGASDNIYPRNAGIPAFGISGIFNDIDDNRAHGRDERVRVRSFYTDLEFQYRLFRALGGGH
jgi:acetylornithine deacetylase/succinyl-diaminopimelate desuccinylase-like protein